MSHHLKQKISTNFPKNVVQKPDVKEICEKSVIFEDGSEYEADVIFYCTGASMTFIYRVDDSIWQIRKP